MAQAQFNEQLAEVLQSQTSGQNAVQSVLEAKFLLNFKHPDFMGLYGMTPNPISVNGGTFIYRQIYRPVPQTYNPTGTPEIYNPRLNTLRIFADSHETLPLEVQVTDIAGFLKSDNAYYDVQAAIVGNFIENAADATMLQLTAEATKLFQDNCITAYQSDGSVEEDDANLWTLPQKASVYRNSATNTINYELWQWLADKVGILEQKITQKAIGVARSRIHIFLDPRLYKNLTTPNGIVGVQAIADATVDNIPMRQTIAGAPLHKNILLNKKFAPNSIHKTIEYDFTKTVKGGTEDNTGGIAALIFAEDSFALPMNFNGWLPTKSQDTGFPRLVGHYQYGKGLTRPDFAYVVRYANEK